MIYSTNRTSVLGGSALGANVNESYFGIGAENFYQECAQDELSIFEMAIKSDIDEALIGESSYELQALNEGFFESAAKKIKELMTKLKEWLSAVFRSAFAKLSALLVRDNAQFAKIASKQIAKMKNKDKFKYTGKIVLTNGTFDKIKKRAEDAVKDLIDMGTDFTNINPSDVDDLIKTADEIMEESTVENMMEETTKDVTDAGFEIVKGQLKILEELGKKDLKSVKETLNKSIKNADKMIQAANKMEKKTDEDKEKANAAMKAASKYKQLCQHMIKTLMSGLKAQAKVARKVVAKAMGATPKNEGVEFDEELNDALIEAVEYEYDSALEEMSEGCKNEESDDVDDDFDDEDED